jgi:hypothetical protein
MILSFCSDHRNLTDTHFSLFVLQFDDFFLFVTSYSFCLNQKRKNFSKVFVNVMGNKVPDYLFTSTDGTKNNVY